MTRDLRRTASMIYSMGTIKGRYNVINHSRPWKFAGKTYLHYAYRIVQNVHLLKPNKASRKRELQS